MSKVFVHFSNERLLRVPAGPSTYEVMRAQIVRMRDTFTSFEAEIVFPGPSFWADSYRYACISWGDDASRTMIASGEVVGMPMGLAGSLVTIEIACRAPDHTSRVTAALAPVRARLGKHLAPEDDAALVELGMVSLYTDPVTHAVARAPFGGNAGSVIDLYGEGAAAGQSEVFAIDMLPIAEPATSFTLEANARHVQQYTGLVDIDVPQFEYYGGTVPSYFQGGDGDNLIMSFVNTRQVVGTKTVRIRPRFVDPTTCNVIPGKSQSITRYRAFASMKAAITSRASRDETVSLKVATNVGPVNGARTDSAYTVVAAEMTGVNYFDQQFMRGRPGGVSPMKFRCTRPSAFLNGEAIADASKSVVDGLVEISVRRAMDHVYCVEMQLEIPAEIALFIDTTRRVRLHDVRLPGGRATGWVVGVRAELGETDGAVITLLCPIVSRFPVISGAEVTNSISVPGGPVRIFRTLGAPAGYEPKKSGIIGAIEDGDGDFFVSGVTVTGGAAEQLVILNEIDNSNGGDFGDIATDITRNRIITESPEAHLQEVQIAVTWESRMLSEDVVDEVEIGQISIQIDEGISYD